jgi:hypothetical protein
MSRANRQWVGAMGGLVIGLALIGIMPLRGYADATASLPASGTLFTPAPLGTLPPMVTDRPGQTNGPYTVAPGHLQIETGVVNYTYDHGTSLHRFDLFSQTEFRVGLVPNAEFDVVINPYSWQRQGDVRSSGVGDTTLQGKWTIWSDAAATTAFGAIPFVTLPTSQHGLGVGGTEGGVSFPFAAALPAGFGLGVMPGIAATRNSSGDGYHTQITASFALQHQIVGNLSAFGEFASSIDASHSRDWVGTIDFGLVYLLTDNLQIDMGMNVGVTHAAPDLNPFLGLSVRF